MATRGSPRKSQRVVVLMGAGASVEAGAPTAWDFTRMFSEFSQHFGDDAAIRIENTFRRIQVAVAEQTGSPASSVDFETVLGVLTDLIGGQMPRGLGMSTIGPPAVRTEDSIEHMVDAVTRMLTVLRELLDVNEEDTDYLGPILSLRTPREPLDVFTLNFDLAFEHLLKRRRVRFTDGFVPRRSTRGYAIWTPSELDRTSVSVRLHKLHGSLNWAILQPGPRPGDGALPGAMDDYLARFPVLARIQNWQAAHLHPPGSLDGAAMALNIGTRKELMYSTTPFTELFQRFYAALMRADVCLIAGYSFRDERVNQLIEECVVQRRGALRLVVVDPSVFRVADRLSTLWEFFRSKVASFEESDLGTFLSTKRLSSVVRKRTETAAPRSEGWGTSIFPAALPIQSDRDGALIQQWWLSLGRLYDAMSVREEAISAATPADIAAPTGAVVAAVRRLVDLMFQIQSGFDALMECINFGPYFGTEHLLRINRLPGVVSAPSQTAELSKAKEQLAQWISAGINRYRDTSEEFLSGVTNPEYGKGLAPDNFAMAELVARDALKGVREAAFAIDNFAEALGLERPMLFPRSHD